MFKKIKKRYNSSINNYSDSSFFDVGSSFGGKKITEREIMTIPVVKSAIDYLVGILSSLDVQLYNVKTNEVLKDKRVTLLNHSTNSDLTVQDFRRAMLYDGFIYGNSYAYLKRKGLEIESIVYVPHNQVTVMDSDQEDILAPFKDVKITVGDKEFENYDFVSLCLGRTMNGFRGISLVDDIAQTLGISVSVADYLDNTSATGFIKRGIIKAVNRIDKEVAIKLKLAWSKLFQEKGTSLLMLSNGLDYQDISSSLAENQVLGIKKANNAEIANAIGVPMSILDNSCTESQYRQFVQARITPIVKIIEESLNKSLLLNKEYGVKEFRLNTDGLLRTDTKAQAETLQILLNAGIITKNEARTVIGYNDIEGLDNITFSLGNVLLNTETGELTNFNMGTTSNINEPSTDGVS